MTLTKHTRRNHTSFTSDNMGEVYSGPVISSNHSRYAFFAATSGHPMFRPQLQGMPHVHTIKQESLSPLSSNGYYMVRTGSAGCSSAASSAGTLTHSPENVANASLFMTPGTVPSSGSVAMSDTPADYFRGKVDCRTPSPMMQLPGSLLYGAGHGQPMFDHMGMPLDGQPHDFSFGHTDMSTAHGMAGQVRYDLHQQQLRPNEMPIHPHLQTAGLGVSLH